MDDEANVGFVDTHPEAGQQVNVRRHLDAYEINKNTRYGGADDLDLAIEPVALRGNPLILAQALKSNVREVPNVVSSTRLTA